MTPMNVDVRDAAWRKSRRSVNNGACVEVALAREGIMVRDSVDPAGSMVQYTPHIWRSFIAATKLGSHDVLR
jgi:Domain of unknown function (DUF397)